MAHGLGASLRMYKGASPLVPSCTVHAPFQPVQHLVSPFLAILGQVHSVRFSVRNFTLFPLYRVFVGT